MIKCNLLKFLSSQRKVLRTHSDAILQVWVWNTQKWQEFWIYSLNSGDIIPSNNETGTIPWVKKKNILRSQSAIKCSNVNFFRLTPLICVSKSRIDVFVWTPCLLSRQSNILKRTAVLRILFRSSWYLNQCCGGMFYHERGIIIK